ncbi:MAG: hypothetical protein PHG42_08225 [Bacteroides sp.]|nr:hypothetical protein [Bacteroides sp.]MDD4804317.1 hypothetical protein [Candidatus Paceibacterota bacterium]
MVQAKCSNCTDSIDCGNIKVICGNEYSNYFGQTVRYDFRCPSHPNIQDMMESTECGRRLRNRV